MTHRLLILTIVCLMVGKITCAQPVWTFSVVVAVEKQTADYYQQTRLTNISEIVKQQIATVNANFNQSTNLKGRFNFRVDSIYVFDGDVRNHVFGPHPKYDYNLVVNGFSDNSVGGGWYGSYHTIYHSWSWDYFNGTFGAYATDGLTHEFGHSRGAIDLYALRVEGKNNPISHEAFEPVNSIMNYPYGNTTWDEHTTNIFNHFGAATIDDENYIGGFFPATIGIKAVDAQGKGLPNVPLDIYPVDWFSYALTANPVQRSSTDKAGIFQFSSNPFQPGIRDYPWRMRYSNFLIKAVYNSVAVYAWMPLYDVQNAYFKNGVNSDYTIQVQFPVTAPTIRLATISDSTICPGASLSASFTLDGTFETGNSFILFIVDKFNNSYGIQSVVGSADAILTGIVPNLSPATYKVRVVSNKPYAISNEFALTIKPMPAKPAVQASVVCQHATPPVLSATGQNLLWYTTPTGGTGSTSAPPINTSQLGQSMYYVSQSVDGCEGPRATLSLSINPVPAAPVVVSKQVCQFTTPQAVVATGTGLTWYDMNGNAFASAPLINTDKEATFSYRVTQTITGCEGPAATLVVHVRPVAIAKLTGSQTLIEGQSASLQVELTGDSPWTFTYQDSTATGAGSIQSVQASTTPYTIVVKPIRSTAYYLTSVSNVCGHGIPGGERVVLNVIPLLGIEDPSLAEAVAVFPVPATTIATVHIRGVSAKTPASLQLTTLTGQPINQQEVAQETSTLSLGAYPAGMYILQIRMGDRTASKRVVKL